MTHSDAMKLLRDKCAELSQAEVARRLGRSSAAISQILSGKYRGAPDEILKRVVEVFSGLSVDCPVMGTVTLFQCSIERKRPFCIGNNQLVSFMRACPDCKHNK